MALRDRGTRPVNAFGGERGRDLAGMVVGRYRPRTADDAGVPYRPAAAWNSRLVSSFGGDCGTGYHQRINRERDLLPIVDPVGDLAGYLGKGYMTSESPLTTFGVACNQILSAETVTMVKEHIVEAYGRVDHAIGTGGPGGAIQQYTITAQYPGLLDGGVRSVSFPDVATTLMTPHDRLVLTHVFDHDLSVPYVAARSAA